MKFRCGLLALSFFVVVNVTAQHFVLDGSTIIKVSIRNPVAQVPIFLETFHSFPVFDHSEVSDSLSVNRNPIYVRCPVRTLQEGDLTVGDQRIHLMMVPGDTISVELNNPAKDARIDFKGKTKDIQLYYLQKSKRFPISILQQMMNAGGSTANLSEFKVKADNLYLQEETFWKSAINNSSTIEGKRHEHQQPLPPWFVRYETDAMRYNNAMIRVSTIGYQEFTFHRKSEILEGYFDFLKSAPLSNDTAMYEHSYQFFLLHYFPYKAGRTPGIADHSKEFQLADELLGKAVADFYKLNSIGVDLISSPARVLTELERVKFPTASQHLVDYLRGKANSKIKTLGPGDDAPNFYLEDRIDSLVSLSQFNGEVVYLSFWFAGCKPCIEEFPFENDLVTRFEGKPVKVISICTHTSKTKWLEMIDTHSLKTVNLYANKAWANKLEENYVVGAYPHYVLIGRDGRIIQNFAKRPREVSKEIEGALDH